MKRRGFTLIELLVVIAIIAILAAILFPVFARARAKAQQSNCLSNVKQLMLGVTMYLSDYDQTMPTYDAVSGGNPGLNRLALCQAIFPYVKNGQIYNCPSAKFTRTYTFPPNGTDWAYAVNYNNCSEPNGNIKGVSADSVSFPAEFFYLADSSGQISWSIGDPRNGPGCAGNEIVGSWHNEGTNVALLDGHAKWYAKNAPVWGGCNYPIAGTDVRHFWLGSD
ncbi:MAG TPA: prepilin-type N-terminal cleavage/methylation domain-containing protein [Armatimonadota bacterium]|jgi:prepilin-type N-terminal cleavage/methylation domain-containing protein/prepilin-type processing-associated H-X9-DG protein